MPPPPLLVLAMRWKAVAKFTELSGSSSSCAHSTVSSTCCAVLHSMSRLLSAICCGSGRPPPARVVRRIARSPEDSPPTPGPLLRLRCSVPAVLFCGGPALNVLVDLLPPDPTSFVNSWELRTTLNLLAKVGALSDGESSDEAIENRNPRTYCGRTSRILSVSICLKQQQLKSDLSWVCKRDGKAKATEGLR